MKKLLIILLLLMVGLTGCIKNSYEINEGSLTLTIRDDFAERMPYDETPSFTFTFEGIIRTIEKPKNSIYQPYYVFFAGNDDFHLSEQISNFFAKYEGKIDFVIVEERNSEKARINHRDEEGEAIPEFLDIDDGKEYYEIAFIKLENGMKLSLAYRRFTSDEVTYYVWRYENNMSMTLYYPLMVIEENGVKEIVLMTLPNRIEYQVGPGLVVSKILKNPDYLEDAKYTLKYLEEHETLYDKQKYVKDYYINECGGEYVGDKLHFTYLGIEFSVEFLKDYFTIRYVGKN